MCGIAGILEKEGLPVEEGRVRRMTALLAHRGPDDEGLHCRGAVGLGHRRLSIIDLSPQAGQPMANEDGSLWIVFNGEIYNFAELRRSLESRGHRFRSRSDTEVILHLYEEEGSRCLQSLQGMFAFALWDAAKGELFLARDRVGKKPLYYMDGRSTFRFASEIKALLADDPRPPAPRHEAIHHYLTYQYVPSPWTAFEGIEALPPAHYLLLRGGRAEVRRYWKLSYLPKSGKGEAESRGDILSSLRAAVKKRLVSDVPLGAFLSGGVDSGAVVALMAELSPEPVKTFSIGFEEEPFDELPFAREVARRFGTDHREFIVKPDALAVVDHLVWHFNQPFADPSAIPTWYVARMARNHVTVVLNGDGGDEDFAGYPRHLAVLRTWAREKYLVPPPARKVLAGILRALGRRAGPRGVLSRAAGRLDRSPALENALRHCHFTPAEKAALYSGDFAASTAGVDSFDLLFHAMETAEADHVLDRALSADVAMYLPDDLLVKVDVAAMAHSLEARSPFLDHHFMELAARLPAKMKLKGGASKYILKEALRGVLPESVLKRPKMGFGVPLERWFRGELREFVHDLLLGRRALERGYFRPGAVEALLKEHMSGDRDRSAHLWDLLFLELWHRTFIDAGGMAPPPAPRR